MAMKMNEKIAKRIVDQVGDAVLVNLSFDDFGLFFAGHAGDGMKSEFCTDCLTRKLGICSAFDPPENNLAIYILGLKAESLQRLYDIIPFDLDFDTDNAKWIAAIAMKENKYYKVVTSLKNKDYRCKIRIQIVLTDLCYFALAKAKNVRPLCDHTLSYLRSVEVVEV